VVDFVLICLDGQLSSSRLIPRAGPQGQWPSSYQVDLETTDADWLLCMSQYGDVDTATADQRICQFRWNISQLNSFGFE